ncbi:hypothetical protein SteCoe_19663 [Stentor coeruleus]|uniref:PH domain-containing protein n=1 Tax=Stentor coeruleus TaxID=5963 RepID=A0A1R2BU19_9CILI|nr:hypothetical protein SteCoe_19663 [Stentor coeruleus]
MAEEQHQRSRSQNSDKLVNKSGWIFRKSTGIIKKFKKCYIILENKHLYIYTNDLKVLLKAIINFDQVESTVSFNSRENDRIILRFKDNSVYFEFKGPSEEISEWYTLFSQHIKNSSPTKNPSFLGKTPKKFWKFDNISNYEFMHSAQTGDIILFKGRSKICLALRGIMNSEFDHIGVIYILNNLIYIFESTRSTGVILTSWTEFMEHSWYNMYSRIAYRKLILDRNECFYNQAHEFVVESEGKPYKLLKLSNDDHKGYFCSELVAEFYRRTGVIYHNTPAKKFMPKNFINGYGVNIIQGELGPLQDIKFNVY